MSVVATPADAIASAPQLSSEERAVVRKAMWRLLPFLVFCYFVAYLDRVNVGFAALTMNADLAISATRGVKRNSQSASMSVRASAVTRCRRLVNSSGRRSGLSTADGCGWKLMATALPPTSPARSTTRRRMA